MITEQNITKHELIGLDTAITSSSNSQLVGLCGKIIDETKSMFLIDTLHGVKMIPKDNSMWKFDLVKTNITINGALISKRSYERIGDKA